MIMNNEFTYVNKKGATSVYGKAYTCLLYTSTNREATNGRTITVGSERVRIKKAPIMVSDSNADLLQLSLIHI